MKIDAQVLNDAISELENKRRVPRDEIIASLKDAMEKAYCKELAGPNRKNDKKAAEGLPDALVRANIDVENGVIELWQVKIIKKDDDIQDDFLEYPLEEAIKENSNYKEGDEYLIPCDIANCRNAFAMAVKNMMKQKLAEKEKGLLMLEFKDKLHTLITGKVDTIDEKGAAVNIGRATVFLTRRQMIGDENFAPGDPIKLYVADISSSGKAGAQIIVSRSNGGFLQKLFEEEIHDVYDHTIEIKGIARRAGIRSKVAVYCEDPSIDPAGTCIGPSGTRIQRIVNQLGNGTTKEKIDIISYSDIPGLYILEALKPARVVGVSVNEQLKTATAVVKDDSVALAIGPKGVNINLAHNLTGYTIDVITETKAIEDKFEFVSLEELQLQNSELIKERLANKKKAAKEEHSTSILPGLPEGYVAPQARIYKDEKGDIDEALEQKVDEDVVEITTGRTEKPAPQVEEEKPQVSSKEEKQEEKPVVDRSKVTTTTTLEDLEKSLEEKDTKEKKNFKKNKKTSQKSEEKEEPSSFTKVSPEQRMAIYTEEEQKALDEEEALANEEEYEEDDVDYDDYDDYYDK